GGSRSDSKRQSHCGRSASISETIAASPVSRSAPGVWRKPCSRLWAFVRIARFRPLSAVVVRARRASAEAGRSAVYTRISVAGGTPCRAIRSYQAGSAKKLSGRFLSKAQARPLGSRRKSGFLRSEEHTSELQSRENLVCRLLLEKKKKKTKLKTKKTNTTLNYKENTAQNNKNNSRKNHNLIQYTYITHVYEYN